MMATERSPYYPELVDKTLREWDKWLSLAEGLSSSLPDAHRHPEGGIPDKRRAADRVADVERAIRYCLRENGLEWRTVRAMQTEGTIRGVCTTLNVRWDSAIKAYKVAVTRMAAHLGWEPDEAE